MAGEVNVQIAKNKLTVQCASHCPTVSWLFQLGFYSKNSVFAKHDTHSSLSKTH